MAKDGPVISIAAAKDKAAEPLRFSHNAMATLFEVLVHGQAAEYAQQAAWAAFDEVDRLEKELSRFIPSSDVSRLAVAAPGAFQRVGIATYECLQAAARIHRETGGAFDVTVGALMALWKTKEGEPLPSPPAAELEAARARTGMGLVLISEAEPAVGVKVGGVRIDLGGIGKGYAVDRVVDVLREWGIDRALVHGGLSTVRALGAPPGRKGWRINLGDPEDGPKDLGIVHLKDLSLSGSGVVHKKHIIDPRTGRPVEGRLGAWSLCETGTDSDALSTAFMVMAPAEVEKYCGSHPKVSGMLVLRDSGGRKVLKYGPWDQ
jgi:thiamine biosynthesis lipoprotein